ncbi:MAG: sugar ABC transporter permease [Spirochaetaceae bacterium]|nr:sugar ABC transporter permease [Spirochaetaceae bacterium]
MRYDIITPARFAGPRNWQRLWTDTRMLLTLKNTAVFVLLLVPMHTVMGTVLALGVNALKNKAGIYLYRTLYYFPTLVTSASVTITWGYLLSTDTGVLNYYLRLLGINAIPWLASSFWVYPATMLFSLWKFVGTYFLYFFIGLQNIDQGLIDAAKIDGANSWQRLKNITLPMLSPTLLFVIITQLIGCIQIFEEPYLLTKGGPGDASRSISLYIYEMAYRSQQYGYASAVSLVLLLIILLVTLIQIRGSDMWVNYDRE